MEIILNKQNILYLLLLVMSSALAYLLFSDSETYVSEYKEKIKVLRHQADSINTLNENLDLKIVDLQNSIDEKSRVIESLNEEIEVIRKETQDKMDAIDRLSNREFDSIIRLIEKGTNRITERKDKSNKE